MRTSPSPSDGRGTNGSRERPAPPRSRPSSGEGSTASREEHARVLLTARRNFRDLGGYATADGASVRPGLVFRSAHLHDLDEVDRDRLACLGIRTVCDLRGREEAAARPGAFDGDPAVRLHPLGVMGSRATGDPVQTIIERGITEVTPEHLGDFYCRFVDEHPGVYARIVELCADTDGHSVVIHCSAGKDRTGIASALLLSVLGVDDDVVLADYELTNELWSPYQIERAESVLRSRGLDPDALRTYFLAPAEVMVRTLDHVRGRWGSVAGYLTGPGGLDAAVLDRLRQALLAT